VVREKKFEEVSQENVQILIQLQELNNKYFDVVDKLSASTKNCIALRKEVQSAKTEIREYEGKSLGGKKSRRSKRNCS
jgi:septal ring factor EnvC (AmiA/AmiB activator)